jgi:hypothetical protein
MTSSSYSATSDSRKTIAYTRVSIAEQAEVGLSFDAQSSRIAAYCAAMGWPTPEPSKTPAPALRRCNAQE